EKLGARFLKLANIHPNIKEKDLALYKDTNNAAFFRGGATYADAISFGAEKVDKKLLEEFAKVKGKKVIAYNADSDLSEYIQLYQDLSSI
ncbi:MAG: starch synthase, partial [Bacteroidota bacterium]